MYAIAISSCNNVTTPIDDITNQEITINDSIKKTANDISKEITISWKITDTSLFDPEINDASVLHLFIGDTKKRIHSSFSNYTTPQTLFSSEDLTAIKDSNHTFSEIIPTNIISGTFGFHAGLSEGFYVIEKSNNEYEVFCFYLDEDMNNYEKELVLTYSK